MSKKLSEVVAVSVAEIRAAFAYDADAVSQATGLCCEDESLTDQSQAEECDINELVRRFGVTGQIPVLNRLPIQADFVGAVDYHSAMNALIQADELFLQIPADIRARFDHDPGRFVAFCSDEANRSELIEMGLVPRPVVSDPAPGVQADPQPS